VLARLEDRLVRAPFDGVLGFRQVSPGTLVTPGTQITTLDDVSVIKLDFTIPETQLAAVRAEQEVRASSAGIPDRVFVGTVRTVGSRVDPVTRAVAVRAIIPNADNLLKPGMLMNVNIVTREAEAFVISEAALIEGPSRVSVYVIDSESRARKQDIEVASRRRGKVEVISGLDEGDFVVTRGTVKLSDGVLVSLPADTPLG
jgi:membrane fusion protein (multidrug efflux system)